MPELKFGKVAIVVLVSIMFVAIVSATATMLYLLSKNASLSITANPYGVELYAEETSPTTVISEIQFAPMMVNSPNSPSTTNVMYLFAKDTPQTYTLKWACPDLPTGFTLTAYWNLAGTFFYPWNENETITATLVLPTSGTSGMRLYFEIDGDNTIIQDFNFDINIYAGM
jgi:hypothetical protein